MESLPGLAAVMVVLVHLRTDFIALENFELVQRGYLFVDLFFVLSGFVIAHIYQYRLRTGGDIWRFLLLRLGRMYPLFLLTLLFYFLEPIVEGYTGDFGMRPSYDYAAGRAG